MHHMIRNFLDLSCLGLKLKTPIYSETAAYGHMGRESKIKPVTFKINGQNKSFEVETFTWEKLDCQEEVKSAFSL